MVSGSPEQVWGCALWAGRPGPFFVFSFFLYFALLFWYHTLILDSLRSSLIAKASRMKTSG